MPRYQEQAEQLVDQLAAIRRSLSSLTEELKQVSLLFDGIYTVIN